MNRQVSMSKIASTVWLAIVIFMLSGMVALPVMAEEVIERLEADIKVKPDSSVEITETIRVHAEGEQIQRGIFRDIPTVLAGEGRRQVRQVLDVLSVKRNGEPERYTVNKLMNGKRIQIGRTDAILPHGTHTYEIRYRIDRAARMFQEHDELYWNATGNFWELPILKASALVTLPEGAEIRELNVFTGPQGATEKAAHMEQLEDNAARFDMTQPLAVREGMTIAVAFEKGALLSPDFAHEMRYWLSDYREVVGAAALLLVIFLYFFSAWYRVGRSPTKGTIIPRFYAPEGVSPALIHFVYYKERWKKKGWTAFSAAVVSLAVKGLVTLGKEDKKAMTLETTGKAPDSLPPGEKVIFDFLRKNSPVTTDAKHGRAIQRTKSRFTSALQKENRSVFFTHNRGYTLFGVALFVVSILLMLSFDVLELGDFIAMVLSCIPLLPLLLVMQWAIRKPLVVSVLVGAIVAVATLSYLKLLIGLYDLFGMDLIFIALLLSLAITIIFGTYMGAHTLQGRKVMDEIEGFKMYLETAEKERLNFQSEPDMTVLRYEAILPYAMALGVEKPWTERFENDLTRHAISDVESDYRPRWYSGDDFTPSRLSPSMSGITAGVASAMMAARPASASSSGFSSSSSSSSGSSSGGGGGGGGGGGW
ncbi:DUF2207 domain-containing protein [Halomonas dongshanensis]|uniref:DUF2207 domain-containing protein n=1 Tax=Halomonas dongshanensis TaxID=2890835 RepID=A0ABT2E8K8_9GAMM|nr:DUF2207 domain-containing protein [Halomonas dongshanensis]MCS2607875.1 DUF2207 domain-containing protein [Halomonas dongshanensis]